MTFHPRSRRKQHVLHNSRRLAAAVRFVDLGANPMDVPTSIGFVSETGIMQLPAGWTFNNTPPIVSFEHLSGLRVIASEEIYPSGPDGADEVWLHVSASRAQRVPDWQDMCRIKDAFVGEDRVAVQVHPPKAEYINHHPHVLHLWCNLDRRLIPDLRKDHEQMGRTL